MSKEKFRPVNDQVLIKITDDPSVTEGGIHIPDQAKKTPQRGVVVAVGRGRVTDQGKLIEPTVRPGEEVLYPKYSGAEVKLEQDVKHVVMREEAILGVFE